MARKKDFRMTPKAKKIVALGASFLVVGFIGNKIVKAIRRGSLAGGDYPGTKYPLLWPVFLKGESRSYNDYNYKAPGLKGKINAKDTLPFSRKLLTDMTVGEVKKYQAMPKEGSIGQLWAVGRFQYIPVTMRGVTSRMGIKDSQKFDKRLQVKMADNMIDKNTALYNYLNKKVPDTKANLEKAALGAAMIWSSIGVPYPVNGKGYNQSYYPFDRASVDTKLVQEALKAQRKKL